MNFPAAARNLLLSSVLVSIATGAALFTARAFASPPPPPQKQIKVSFLTQPAGNRMGPQYVTRMKMWYNDTLFYEGTSAYGQNYPDGQSPASFRRGGTLRTELTLLNTSGGVLTTQTQTVTNMFDSGKYWLGGQVFTPDRKHTHIWRNGSNQEIHGYLSLQFHIDEHHY